MNMNTEMNNSEDTVLKIHNLRKFFPVKKRGLLTSKKIGNIQALAGVSLNVKRGEIVGVVGESGSGKTTLARVLLNLIPPTAGDAEVFPSKTDEIKSFHVYNLKTELQKLQFRKLCQIVFQDPYASLNPRMTVMDIIAEALIVHHPFMTREERTDRVIELLKVVGLETYHASRFPHEFSGGQRQRIGIARAIAVEPEVLILDEPVSALDVAVQAQIINLLFQLQEWFNLTYIFIAHDLAVVRHISDRIVVMYLGKIMEIAPSDEFFSKFAHPYTEALISAVPIPNPLAKRGERIVLEGDPPNPANPPSGCVFRTRCRYAQDQCAEKVPSLEKLAEDHFVACFYPLNLYK